MVSLKNEGESMDNRIQGVCVDIDNIETKKFFNDRAKKNIKYLYNRCLYQDNNPELALLRDEEEKTKILPLLDIHQNDKVLDIGCGVGRWGEEVLKAGACYCGVDYSEDILKIAENYLSGRGDFKLICSSFQDASKNIDLARFNKVIISGCLMYINDTELQYSIEKLQKLLPKPARLYLRETIAIIERLTLSNFYSEELQTNYNAIYRTTEEYVRLLQPYFRIQQQGPLYESSLNNRNETLCYYFIAEKKS